MSAANREPFRKWSDISIDRSNRVRLILKFVAARFLILVSFIGTVSALHFGLSGIFVGLLLQSMLTFAQYTYRDRRSSPIYLVTLALDACLTFIGFYPFVGGYLVTTAEMVGLAGIIVIYISYAIIAAIALLVSWLPPGWLVDHDE
jgi:hypothetical protein